MMWKPIAVLAAAGSVSVHLIVLTSYSGGDEDMTSASASPIQQQVQASASGKTMIAIGEDELSANGPSVKIARDTFFRFPEGTRIISKTATDSLMIVDLAIPIGRAQLIEELRGAVKQTPYGVKLHKEPQGSIKLEFQSSDGSGQIVLDEVSDKKTSASIRIYGQGLFSRI